MISVYEHYDFINTSAQTNAVHEHLRGAEPGRQNLCMTYSVSYFISMPPSHTQTHTHAFYSSVTVIKHALSQPSFILYTHCQAAMTLSSTMHLKYASLRRQMEFKVCLWLRAAEENMGLEQAPYVKSYELTTTLISNIYKKKIYIYNKDFKVVRPRVSRSTGSHSLSFWDQQKTHFLCESGLFVSLWSWECRFSYNLRYLHGPE